MFLIFFDKNLDQPPGYEPKSIILFFFLIILYFFCISLILNQDLDLKFNFLAIFVYLLFNIIFFFSFFYYIIVIY